MLIVIIAASAGFGSILAAIGTEASALSPTLFFVGLILVCAAIGIFAVLAGVGGGVIFTPLFMGFTNIDSYIIRSTGLFVATVGALIAARPFLRKGIANIRLLYTAAVPYAVFAVIGSLLAGYMKTAMGPASEAYIQGALGMLVIGIGVLFVLKKNSEYPDVKQVDPFTASMNLPMPYFEDSLGKVVHYKLKRARVALVLFCGVGLMSGLFGLGAGWAMVPVFNLVMLAPLKVAATCSKVMISIGDTAAVWPYIQGGGMFPLFAVPCMIGMVIGTLIGTKIMLRVKAGFIRPLIVIVMFTSGIRLLMKALG
ncbi:MAG: sulfite exporter TauE/SafE family protein [Deltaproteobacteria bacterium]|nr:sulfite exporter TauE/SafE family protein [Deltaproteobacteria bacterium]